MAERRFLASGIQTDELAGVLQDARLRWVYAERLEDIVLLWAADFHELGIPLAKWHHGRAFGKDMEVAWWRDGSAFQVRTIITNGSIQNALGGSDPQGADYESPLKKAVLLLGELDEDAHPDDPTWSTARIPKYLPYPVEGKPERVALVVARYRVNGMFRDQRFVELKEG